MIKTRCELTAYNVCDEREELVVETDTERSSFVKLTLLGNTVGIREDVLRDAIQRCLGDQGKEMS